MLNLIGKTLGQYRILEQIGLGGMATVYKAYQPSMDRFVAIKVLPPYFSQDEQFIKRFQREAHAIARLEHAHILPVFDYGEHEGVTFIAMRYIESGTLKEYLAKGFLPLDEVERIIGQVGNALDYAHRQGIIHRDVKPSNILLGEQGNLYLADFGLARMVASEQHLTGTGVGIGTPAYMSPEQGLGNHVDHRSDIYSLGVILYEMVTGQVPFEAETPMAVVLKHINEPLPLPCSVNPAVPQPVEMVILKALAKDPEHRYQSARDLAEALSVAVRKVQQERLQAADAPTLPPPPAIAPARKFPVKLTVTLAGIFLVAVLGIWISQAMNNSPTTGQVSAPTLSIPVAPLATAAVGAASPALIPASPMIPTSLRGQISICETDLCIIVDNHTDRLGLGQAYQKLNGFSWSPDGNQIVFSACFQSNSENCANLFIADLNTGSVNQIAYTPESRHQPQFPAWSPDGAWIAFHDGGNLALIHPDGTGLRKLPATNYCPRQIAWAPDSQRLAFIANLCDDPQLVPAYLVSVRPDGSELNLLWNAKSERFAELAYGPGGNMVAFRFESGATHWVLAVCQGGATGCYYTSRRELALLPAQWQQTHHPRWGKDANVPPPTGAELITCDGAKNGQICLWDRRTGTTQITHDLAFKGQMGSKSWSPDGKQIVFSGEKSDGEQASLYIINSDGTGLRQLTSDTTYDHEAVWSPDGEWIVFHRDCSAWLIRPNGTQAHVLVPPGNEYCVEGPVWSPDSQKIIWHKMFFVDRPSEIWMINRDGSDSHMVTSLGVRVTLGWHAFSPDGSMIIARHRFGDALSQYLMYADGSEMHEIDWEPYWWNAAFWPPWGVQSTRP